MQEIQVPGSLDQELMQTVSDSKEFVSSLLRGIKEVQFAVGFFGLTKKIEPVKATGAPVLLNSSMKEVGIDLHRLDPKSPAHRMYFPSEDIAHEALVAALDQLTAEAAAAAAAAAASETAPETAEAKTDEQEEGEVEELKEEIKDKAPEKPPLRLDTAVSTPSEAKKRPGPLDLSGTKGPIAPPLPSALATARIIDDLGRIDYPEGIKSPKIELNVNAKQGKFR